MYKSFSSLEKENNRKIIFRVYTLSCFILYLQFQFQFYLSYGDYVDHVGLAWLQKPDTVCLQSNPESKLKIPKEGEEKRNLGTHHGEP